MCQLASPFSPIILSMREHLPVNGPNVYTTCADGRRCQVAATSHQPRSPSCSPAISQRSSPVYEPARRLTRRCSEPRAAVMTSSQHVYEVRPRNDHRGVVPMPPEAERLTEPSD